MRTWICVLLAGSLLASGGAVGQASGGNTGPAAMAKTGLGQSGNSNDLSVDSLWKVYAFERKGIRYLQVDDQSGTPRAAIAYIGDTFWTLPIGQDVDRVSTPQEPIAIPSGAVQRVVYQSKDVQLSAFESASGVFWRISTP
ncbi:hypothetical protein [Lysobacter sp. CA199]|uniref:hypothetical protein n=1 Tax=Lysobacter sp. CA199 TaxID=3455608 RepID=UPI003F8D746C